MKVFNTDMHVVTFCILIIQFIILFVQISNYSARPSDKSRKYYLILLVLFISYNIFGGLYPDKSKDYIPYTFQIILAYGSGFLLAAYFPYYLYKNFDLKELRFHALYGIFIFLILPFAIYFLIIYLLGFDTDLLPTVKYGIIIPGVYTLAMLYTSSKSIYKKFKREKKKEILFSFAAILPWASMPLLTYYSIQQLPEVIVMNSGFVVFSIFYLRSFVIQQRLEYVNFSQIKEKSALEKLEQQKKSEKEILLQKQQYQKIIHETKAPIAILSDYLNEQKDTSVEGKEFLKNVSLLIKDLTRIYEIERLGIDKYLNLEVKEVCNLSKVIDEAVRTLTPLLKSKNLEVKTNIEEGVLIKSDSSSINRILFNLIDNAIKFSHENGIIEVSLKKKEENIVCWTFKDQGIGMSKATQKNIFKAYNKTEYNGGLGLGMNLIKDIIDIKLKGAIKVISNPEIEKGTTIEIMLPYLTMDAEVSLIEEESNNLQKLCRIYDGQPKEDIVLEHKIKEGNKHSVLLIDDNLHLLSYYANKLSESSNIYVADSGKRALDILKSNAIDLIVSDINMKKMNGIEFFTIIKAKKDTTKIPFIFLTGISDAEILKEADKLQPLAICHKPYNSTKLKNKVDAILYYTDNSNSKPRKKITPTSGYEKAQSHEINKTAESAFGEVLSKREFEVLSLLISGMKIQEIAETLFIAPRTVTTHQQNIYKKYDVSSRVELIARCKEEGEVG